MGKTGWRRFFVVCFVSVLLGRVLGEKYLTFEYWPGPWPAKIQNFTCKVSKNWFFWGMVLIFDVYFVADGDGFD